jgi:hypothetical protein
MSAKGKERSLVLRKFDGVNLLVDQAYLGPSVLRSAANWIPGDTYRLAKTPGNTQLAPGAIGSTDFILKIARAYSGSTRYLYAVTQPTGGGGDELWVSANEGAWAQVQLAGGGNATFTEDGGIYDIEIANGALYVGNGVDPI